MRRKEEGAGIQEGATQSRFSDIRVSWVSQTLASESGTTPPSRLRGEPVTEGGECLL